MTTQSRIRCPSAEAGVALLIAIFALLLISGVAVSLIVMSGTESAIAGNSKANTQAFYAAYAGLEEGRGRLWPGHPQTIDAFVGVNKGQNVMSVNLVRYILNPAPGEVVQPTNLSPDNPYRDTEYQKEFGSLVTAAVVVTTTSTSPVAGLPGQMFKWVRITPKTEFSAGIDTNGDGVLDKNIPLFFDGTNQNLTSTGRQVLRVTALAVMPNGSRRILQYDVAPKILNLSFPAALTFDGYGDSLFPANSNVYYVDGNDHAGCGGAAVQAPKPAIGVDDKVDLTAVTKDLPLNRLTHYIGMGSVPDVENITPTLPPNLQTVTSLENLLTAIQQNATNVVQGPVSTLPTFGSPSNPVINFVNGDLTLSGNITGYGILVVTGTYTSSGTVGWRGPVLVVGQGRMVVSGGGNNEYDGAVLLAKTRDANNNVLPSLGGTYLDWSGGGGNGVLYSSGCIASAQNALNYQILSFREITE